METTAILMEVEISMERKIKRDMFMPKIMIKIVKATRKNQGFTRKQVMTIRREIESSQIMQIKNMKSPKLFKGTLNKIEETHIQETHQKIDTESKKEELTHIKTKNTNRENIMEGVMSINLMKRIRQIDIQNNLPQKIRGSTLKSSQINHHKNITKNVEHIKSDSIEMIDSIAITRNLLMTTNENSPVTRTILDIRKNLVQEIINTENFRYKIVNKHKEKKNPHQRKILKLTSIEINPQLSFEYEY